MPVTGGAGKAGGGSSKSRGGAGSDTIVKKRDNNNDALYNNDEQRSKRDVTEWLVPAFKAYKKNGLNASITFNHGEALLELELNELVALAEVFVKAAEEEAGREYHTEDKVEHLTEDAARFLVAKNDADGSLLGYAHFRFTIHGELADQMEGLPCLFIYDIHVVEVRRLGVGACVRCSSTCYCCVQPTIEPTTASIHHVHCYL